jgi:hypothetical protein
MKEYHKINSIFKRDDKTKRFIDGQYAQTEFEFLKNNPWVFTEKVDGTNVRVDWDGEKVTLGGRTDNAQMPVTLIQRLQELFPVEKFKALYPDLKLCLYGEGYGYKIQSGGKYIPDAVDFVLFDVSVDCWWLERINVEDVAYKLEIKVVPIIGDGTLDDAIDMCRKKFCSIWGNFESEGIVARPKVELRTRNGHRIITKVKCKDFITPEDRSK